MIAAPPQTVPKGDAVVLESDWFATRTLDHKRWFGFRTQTGEADAPITEKTGEYEMVTRLVDDLRAGRAAITAARRGM